MKDCSICPKKPKPGTPYEKTPCAKCMTCDNNSFILPEIIRDRSEEEIKLNVFMRLAGVFTKKITRQIAMDILREPKTTNGKLAGKYKISERQAKRIKSMLRDSIPELFAHK